MNKVGESHGVRRPLSSCALWVGLCVVGVALRAEAAAPSRWTGFFSLFNVILFVALIAQAALILTLLCQCARRRQAERRLSHAYELNQAILHASVSFFLVTDRTGIIRVTNDALLKRLGYKDDELIGSMLIERLIHPDDQAEARRMFIQAIADGQSHRGEIRLLAKDRQIIEVEWEGGFVHSDCDDIDFALIIGIDITGRRETERDLREIRERYSLALEGAEMDTWDLLLTEQLAYLDTRSPETGIRERRIVAPGEVAAEIHPEDFPMVREKMYAHLSGLSPKFEAEYRIQCGQKDYRWMMTRGRVVERGPDGQPTRMAGTQLDISVRREIETALREREERYALAVRAGHLGVWDWDLDTDMVYADLHIMELLGRQEDSLLQASSKFLEWVHPDDYADVKRRVLDVLRGRSDRLVGKFRVRHADGTYRWLLAETRCLTDDQGRQVRLVGTTVDITDLEESQQLLRASEERYRELVGHMSSGVAVFVPDAVHDDFIIRDFNHAAERMGQVSRDQVLGKRLLECFPWAEQVGLMGMLRRVQVSGEPELSRAVCHHEAPNECTWRDYYVYELHSGELVVVYDDVTHRIRAEEALRESEGRLRAFFEAVRDIAFLKDREGRFTLVNPSMSALFGVSPDELIGKVGSNLWPDGCAESIRKVDERALRGESVQYEVQLGEGDNARVLEMSKVPLRDEAGQVTGVCAIARDITQRRKAEQEARMREQQLIQADKLVSLGTLVAGVAHEVNNPNSMIKLALPILRDACEGAWPVLETYFRENGDFLLGGLPFSEARDHLPRLLREMGESSERIARILGELRDFALQRPTLQSEPVDMNAVVRSSITLVGNLIRKSTQTFEVRYATGLPPITGSFHRLEQVLVNLLVNACQAMAFDDDGISVETTCDADRNRVMVTVCDHGRGITPEVLPHITDPFFTTKRDQGGTGLGLSVSSRIVAEHDGSLDFESTPGQGTTATLALPVTPGKVP